MEHRNRSTPQLATDASSTALDGAAATSHGNNHDILREIAEQMRRTRGDIEKQMQNSEGAALHAAILAGQDALSKGKSKEEVAAVIESAGEHVCGRETWMCSGSISLAEALVIGARTERHGTPQEAADLQDMRRGEGAAAAASSSQRRSSSAPRTGGTSSGARSIKKRKSAATGSSCEGKPGVATGDAPNLDASSSLAKRLPRVLRRTRSSEAVCRRTEDTPRVQGTLPIKGDAKCKEDIVSI